MLAEVRRGARVRLGHAVDQDGRADARRGAALGKRVVEAQRHAARHHLRVGEDLRHAVDGTGRNMRGVELRQQLRSVAPRREGMERRRQGDAVGDPAAVGEVVRMGAERRVAEDVAEAPELPVVAGGDDDVAVGDGEHVVGHDGGVGVAEARRVAAGGEVVQPLRAQHRHLAVEQGAVDGGPLPRGGPSDQRRLDGVGGVEAREQVGDGHAGLDRGAVRLAGDRHGAAHALDQEIVAGAGRVGAVLTEARDRADHEAGVQRAERGGVEAVAREAPDLEVLHHDVGVAREAAHQRLPVGRVEIGRDAALAAVAAVEIGGAEVRPVGGGDEGRPPLPRVVARAGALDLDDIGAEVRQQLAAPGAGQDAGQFEDADAGEGW